MPYYIQKVAQDASRWKEFASNDFQDSNLLIHLKAFRQDECSAKDHLLHTLPKMTQMLIRDEGERLMILRSLYMIKLVMVVNNPSTCQTP